MMMSPSATLGGSVILLEVQKHFLQGRLTLFSFLQVFVLSHLTNIILIFQVKKRVMIKDTLHE
jgi:hypothetical protein